MISSLNRITCIQTVNAALLRHLPYALLSSGSDAVNRPLHILTFVQSFGQQSRCWLGIYELRDITITKVGIRKGAMLLMSYGGFGYEGPLRYKEMADSSAWKRDL